MNKNVSWLKVCCKNVTERSLTDHWYWPIQINTTIYGQVISAGELVVKEKYLCSKQENKDWYWKEQPPQQTIMIPTRTIRHPSLDVITIRYVQDIPNNICNRIQAEKAIQKHPIIMTDADYFFFFWSGYRDQIACSL